MPHPIRTVLATADLHWQLYPTGDACTLDLRDYVCSSDADAFVIAGDVADRDPAEFKECLLLFKAFDGLKMVVPGNHDLWTENGDSAEKHRTILPKLARQCEFHYLDRAPLVRGDVAFIGNVGWYDYSFRNTDIGLSLEDYERKSVPGRCTWNDRHFIQWDFSDQQFTEECLLRLRRHYSEVEDEVEQVVCVLHHLAFQDLLYPETSFPLEFCRAYLGSERFGRLLLRCPKVRYLICGHRHGRDSHQENGLESFVVGGEYRKKQVLEINLEEDTHRYIEFSPE
jgi:predicted phosphohydrolase